MCCPSCNGMCLFPGGGLARWQWNTDILLARPKGGDLKSMKVKGRLISFCPLWLQGASPVQGGSYSVVKKMVTASFYISGTCSEKVTVTCKFYIRNKFCRGYEVRRNTSIKIWASPPSWVVHDFNPTNLWCSLYWTTRERQRTHVYGGQREFFSVHLHVFSVYLCWNKHGRIRNCKRMWK
jgi:hypothetical protein